MTSHGIFIYTPDMYEVVESVRVYNVSISNGYMVEQRCKSSLALLLYLFYRLYTVFIHTPYPLTK